MTTLKETHEGLKKILTDVLGPSWRKDFKSYDDAAQAASDKAQNTEALKTLRKYRQLFAEQSRKPPAQMDIHLGRKYANDGYSEEERAASDSVFDNSSSGAHNSAERTDQIGRELPSPDEDEGESGGGGQRGAAPGRVEDSLHHPDRPHSGRPYVWKPNTPRDRGCIKC